MKSHLILLTLVLISCTLLTAITREENTQANPFTSADNLVATHNQFIGSSVFELGNLLDIGSQRPGYYGQLNYGYLFTPKDNAIVEAITWTYYEPLGTYGNSEKYYPGKVRAFGVGLGYQRFFYKNMFVSGIATPFLQKFYNEDDKHLQDGFQLYLQFITGSRLELFNKRWFVEPSLALTCWPINTNFPEAFDNIEKDKPAYRFEPRANFGYKF